MLSLLDAIPLFLGFFGLILGAGVGYNYYGVLGSILGALSAAVAGVCIGAVPRWLSDRRLRQRLARTQREISERSTDTLIDDLRSRRIESAHFIIAELVRRGYDITSVRPFLLDYLTSSNAGERVGGWAAVRQFFPDLDLAGYSPFVAADIRHAAIEQIRPRFANDPVA
jgi:hypothetical protein